MRLGSSQMWRAARRPAPAMAGLLVAAALVGLPDRPPTEDPHALLLAGEAERAAELFAARLAEDPQDVASRVGRVRALLAFDRWREALAEAERYHGALPQADDLRVVHGECLLRAGRLGESADLLVPLLEAERSPPRALIALGRLRLFRGDHAGARKLLDRARDLAPDDRFVAYWSAGAAPTRRGIVARLRHYLSLSEGDDPDRIEAARGKVRLYEVLGERPIWVSTARPERAELPLSVLGDGRGGAVAFLIEVRLGGGKPVRMLLDTGSTGLFVLERIARKRGLETLAEETLFGGGGKKRHRSPRGLFGSLAVGELRFEDALATTTRREIDPYGRFQGLFGISAFQGYRVTIDTANEVLILEPEPTEPGDGGSPYWDVGGQLVVQAATDSGERGLFLLDTGATRSAVSLELAARLPGARLSESVDVRGFGGRLRGSRRLNGVRLRFQDHSTPPRAPLNANDLSVRSRAGGVEISGLVGLDLLAGKRIVVDTTAQRVRLEQPLTDKPRRKQRRERSR